MHLYAFGSLCRGEIDEYSDIDLLALVDMPDSRFDPAAFSVYSYSRVKAIWSEGNPFAWHLALESRLLFAGDGIDFIRELGSPAPYRAAEADCVKFRSLFLDAVQGLSDFPESRVFELSTIFLSVRNIATCFSLDRCGVPVFCRHSALALGEWNLAVDADAYDVLVRARILATRGSGPGLSDDEVALAVSALPAIGDWMNALVSEVAGQ